MKHPQASNWFRASALAHRNLETATASWIQDQGSLTARLLKHCGDHFSVRVLSQRWIKPQFEEAKLLGVPPHHQALLRQVQLLCKDKVMVYARSIIPLRTLRGSHRRLKFLRDKPLGAYLFAHPNLRREQQQLACIQRTEPLFDLAISESSERCDHIWGRRSLFRLDGKALLVSEFFLPQLIQQ